VLCIPLLYMNVLWPLGMPTEVTWCCIQAWVHSSRCLDEELDLEKFLSQILCLAEEQVGMRVY
jgi:hypothetical protein